MLTFTKITDFSLTPFTVANSDHHFPIMHTLDLSSVILQSIIAPYGNNLILKDKTQTFVFIF